MRAPHARKRVFHTPEAHVGYLFRKLSRMLRANRSLPDARSVHQLRTTIRRIETLAASLGKEDTKVFSKFQKVLREIFEKAGRVRDLDVQIEALKTISLPSVEDDKARLQNYLQRQRGKRQRKLANAVESELVKRLPKRQRRAKALLLEAVEQNQGAAPKQTVDLRKEVRGFIDTLRLNNFGMETLHQIRLDVKHLRYAAEAAGPAGEEIVALLKPVQDEIGIWHDWLNLVETSEKILGPLPGHPLMTILRSKMRAQLNNAIVALKPLEAQLSEVLAVVEPKRPGPVLLPRQVQTAAAGAD